MWSKVKRNRSNLVFFTLHRWTDFLNFSRTENEFLNSIFTKILKMKSSFFRNFYFKIYQIFKNFKFNQSVFTALVLSFFAKANQFSSVFKPMPDSSNLMPCT
jgi:hypothetical protein